MTDLEDEILTLDEVAAYLKAGKRTVYRLAQKGEIPAFKLGGTWRFRRSELDRWIAESINQEEIGGSVNMGQDSTAKEGGRFMTTTENQVERDLIATLEDLKYTYRPDIRDRAALEANFREKFEALNRVRLTDSEFQRLLDGVITPDVYNAAQTLRNINSFERDDGTPLNYTLVNIRDWCKNHFEVVNQLRINTDYSHHRYDVLLLINGVPVVQIELKT